MLPPGRIADVVTGAATGAFAVMSGTPRSLSSTVNGDRDKRPNDLDAGLTRS